jgi:hypothetical protein
MFEHRHTPLLSRAEFLGRQLRYAAVSAAIVAGSLFVGALGYRETEGLPWLDATLNAAMILTGMGPVDHDRRALRTARPPRLPPLPSRARGARRAGRGRAGAVLSSSIADVTIR